MTQLITFCNSATGGGNGSVARIMLKKTDGLFALNSTAAKALAAAGAQLTAADYTDVTWLKKPSRFVDYLGANAIFGITNIFEYLHEESPEADTDREKQRLINIAPAANSISSLIHLVQHTLPAGEKIADAGNFVPHVKLNIHKAP